MISNYFIKKEINQVENNHCLSNKNVVYHFEQMINYNHDIIVKDVKDACAVRKIDDEIHNDAFLYSSRNK
jgi:hypothetical protein